MKITAKVHCSSRQKLPINGDGESTVWFTADYSDAAGNRINDEWAKATPLFTCQMTVLDNVPFEAGKAYTLTFDDGEPDPRSHGFVQDGGVRPSDPRAGIEVEADPADVGR